MAFKHQTVLRQETIDQLQVKSDGIYVDAKLGGGGHSVLLLSQLGPAWHFYEFVQDQKAIYNGQQR